MGTRKQLGDTPRSECSGVKCGLCHKSSFGYVARQVFRQLSSVDVERQAQFMSKINLLPHGQSFYVSNLICVIESIPLFTAVSVYYNSSPVYVISQVHFLLQVKLN